MFVNAIRGHFNIPLTQRFGSSLADKPDFSKIPQYPGMDQIYTRGGREGVYGRCLACLYQACSQRRLATV
jgi:hypothetical protein